MPRPRIELPREQIEDFCRRWQIVELSLFGSVLRDDFQPESDIDVLVSFAPDARSTLFDLVRIEDELADILGRKVDLVLKSGIERSENWIRKRAILESAQVVYATR
jgi:predicted nucleotidyltransferase